MFHRAIWKFQRWWGKEIRKQFKDVVIEKCNSTEEGIVIIELENPSPIQVLSKTVELKGMLLLIKKESERYAEKNRTMFQTTSEEIRAFLGINILMGINKLPKMIIGQLKKETMTGDVLHLSSSCNSGLQNFN